ncbi:MAG TPA: alpha/beta fold hydrolase [Pseudonocardiaceae bacterium]
MIPDSTDTFADLDAFLDLPRVAGLWLSPDGRRLVVGVGSPDHKQARFASALWEVDPEGARPARRLTRSAKGESGAAFAPSGDLLFVSARPVPDGDDEETAATLWSLPADGGDARVLGQLPGGLGDVAVAGKASTVLVRSELLPSAADPAGDKEIRTKRKDAHVSAILHEQYPVRFWDSDLGPDRSRLLVADLSDDPDATLDFRDVTGHVPGALHGESSWDISADGLTVVTMWSVPETGASFRDTLVAIDVATGEHRTLADDPDCEYFGPSISPDGTTVAVTVSRRCTPQTSENCSLGVVPTAGGEMRILTPTWDRWPGGMRWTPDGTTLVVQADDQGNSPLWRIDATTGDVTRLTGTGSYTDVRISPDGQWIYALRSAVDHPPAPVRIALADGSEQPLLGPAEALGRAVPVSGRLTEVTTTAEDGTPLRAWLALPHDAGPDQRAPLLLWIHGGPLHSWNAWSWRWNPWLAVAKGYAVLLPDPALSTGYGVDFIQRGWLGWGGTPYTDLMSVTDAAVARDDIDAARTAAMGGSFGGYMANWVAGHTKRFLAIVTHASVWSLDQMGPTTDAAFYWYRELDADLADDNSPNRWAAEITTPMLVIHGDKDYRVPLGEGIRLWWDLTSRTQGADGTTRHKFLYFPDESHWILTPGNIKVWYETVFAFLAHHVLGADWERPALLG